MTTSVDDTSLHTCAIDGCGRVVYLRCYHCQTWCCRTHRALVDIPDTPGPRRDVLCRGCLLVTFGANVTDALLDYTRRRTL